MGGYCEKFTPLTIFEVFFDDELASVVTDHTNMYAN